MLAQAVLHFLSKHQLLFIKLKEDLQVAEMLLVGHTFVLRRIPFNDHLFLLMLSSFVDEDSLACLYTFAISLL